MIGRRQPPAHTPMEIRRALGLLWDDPVDTLDALLRERYRAEEVALLGSGTESVTEALRSLPASHADRPTVALPAYGCYDIGTAAVGAGVAVRFYDLSPDTLGPDPESLRAAVDAGVDGVVITPLYGLPVDWGEVRAVVGPDEAVLIEDAAQGFGATWHGEPVGSHGDLAILSFGRGKGWGGGGGGALLRTRATGGVRGGEPGLDAGAAGVGAGPHRGGWVGNASILARAVAQWVFGRPGLYGLPAGIPFLGLGETVYRPPEEPRPIATFSAALAVAAEGTARAEAEARVRTARELCALLEGRLGDSGRIRFQVPSEVEGGRASYLRLPVLTPSGIAGFADRPAAERAGIMPGYPKPLTELEPLASLALSFPSVPGAEEIVRRLVTVPTHTLLQPGDLEAIVRRFERYGA